MRTDGWMSGWLGGEVRCGGGGGGALNNGPIPTTNYSDAEAGSFWIPTSYR